MTIAVTDLVWRAEGGRVLASGTLHDLFPSGTVGGATEYRRVELLNANATDTLSAVRLFVSVDPGGAAYAVAVANASAFAKTAEWPVTNDAGLTYSTPTTYAGGLTLPNLAPGFKALVVVRRILTGASAANAETNRLIARGTAPI